MDKLEGAVPTVPVRLIRLEDASPELDLARLGLLQ